MELYRAIPASQVGRAEKDLRRHSTMRIPSNVPYVVDNLWESLRPKNMVLRGLWGKSELTVREAGKLAVAKHT
ncbi:hypothetical protein EGV02_07595, partial [Stutzerimonas stutzeri]